MFCDSGRPPAPEKPEPVLPENGPWLAKVTNIDDKANEDDLAFVFRGLQITNVQFVGRERRIGLVEFATRDDLYNAIKGCDGRPLLSRTVHVDVGEPTRAPKPRSAFGSRDREDSAQPAQRPRINLIIPPSAESSTTAAKPELADEYKSAKSNPFGDAKPRDAAAFERKREEERKRSEENAARWKRADDEEKAATQKEEAKERERDRREMGKRSRTENRGKARDNKQKDIIEGAGEVVAAESGASSAGWRRREEKPQPQSQPKPVEQKQEKKSVNAFALLASQDSDHE
jgi:RNA recognition motif-containing protein